MGWLAFLASLAPSFPCLPIPPLLLSGSSLAGDSEGAAVLPEKVSFPVSFAGHV
jgi:hypothetical protein